MKKKKSSRAGTESTAGRAALRRAAGKKGRQRRQQIIDAAKEILISGGHDKLVLREVANRLGITHGNLQYYFPTKDHLLVAIFDQEVEKYTSSMKTAVAATSTKQGRLDAIIDSGLAELKAPETALWRMMMSRAEHSPELAAILKKENTLYEQVLAEELKHIAPNLSGQRRRHIARLIHAILDGLGIQFIYENADGAEMRGLASEVKIALFRILSLD